MQQPARNPADVTDMLAQLSDAIIAVNEAGDIVYLNTAAGRLYGIEAARALGRPLAEVFTTPWIKPDDETAAAALRTHGEWHCEHVHISLDGRTISVDLRITALTDSDGRANGRVAVIRDMTRQRSVEKGLAESSNRFRLALENSPISVFEQDRDLRYTWIYNPRLGYDASSVFGKTDADLLDSAVVTQVTAIKLGVLETGQSANQEVSVAAPGKDPHHFHLTVHPRLGLDGRIEGVLSTAFDITERKQADAALRESEQRYRTLIEATSAVTWSCTPSGLQEKPQPSWMAFTGQSATEILGTGWTRVVHPDDAEAFAARWNDAMARSTPFRSEHRIRRHDGAWRWMRVQAVPIYRDGQIIEWSGMCVDISERKAAEAALRDSEARLARILDQSPAGIVQTDAEGRIVLANNRWCEMMGYDRTEMLGMSVIELTHPTSVEATLETVGRLSRGGPDFQIEKNYRSKDGAILRCHSNVAALRDANGTYQGLLAVVLDMTKRVDAEDRLRDSEARQAFLLQLSDALRAEPDAKAMTDRALRMLVDRLRLDRGYIGVYRMADDIGDIPHQVHDDRLPPLPAQVRLSDFPKGLQILFERTLVIDDVAKMDGLSDNERASFAALGAGAMINATLRKGENTPVWALVASSAQPRVWTQGEVSLVEEVAERIWAAVEHARAVERLRVAHDTFRNLIDRSPFGTYIIDADFRLIQISEGGQKAFANVKPLIGRDFEEVMHTIWPDPFASRVIAHFRHTLATGEPYKAETNERRADLDAAETYDWTIERVTLPDGRPGVVCHFYDLSEKQRQEEHIKLLMGEVNHRAKNMLSLVQSIARQTVATQPQDFIAHFGQRVSALSASQDLLVKSDWKAVQLAELVRAQLAHFGNDRDTRITLDGPPVQLTAAASQSLGMALHELATNAAKYGALSNDTGRVVVRWSLQPDAKGQTQFTMSWTESGGPRVSKPAQRGFGSTMIDDMIKVSLNCEAGVDFAPTGLVWSIGCAAAGLIAGDAPPTPRSNGAAVTADPAPVAGRRILVVEDEALIAMDYSQTLSEAGYVVIGPANSVARALALLAQFGCDAAVLDTNLGVETSEPVARELIRRGTPYIATSGYSREQQPPIMQKAPLLGKPVISELLIAEIERCLGG